MPDESVSIVIRARDAAGRVFSSVQKSIRGMATQFKQLSRTVAITVAAIGGAILGIGKLAMQGSKMITVQRSFNRAVGDKGSEAVKELRTATSGLITNYELMTGYNKALTLGAVENTKEFGQMASTAIALGRAMGIDAGYALESLSTGIARQSRLFLDNIGIVMSVGDANKRYAASLGITTKALTDDQKRVAFRTEALRQAAVAVERLGGVQLNAGDKAQQLGVQLQNVFAMLTQMIARSPQVAAFFDMLREKIEQLTPAFEAMVTNFTIWMGKITDFVTIVGDVRGWTNAIERFERAHIDRLKDDANALDAYITTTNAQIDRLNDKIAELGTTKAGRRKSIYKEMQDEVEGLTAALNYANEQRRLLQTGAAGGGGVAPGSSIPAWYGRPRMAGSGGGVMGFGVAGTGMSSFIQMAREAAMRQRMITYQRNYLAGLEDERRAKDLAAQQTEQMAMTVVHAFGAIAQSGSNMISSLIGGAASIISAIPGVGPVAQAGILTGGSILSRLFGSGPTPVLIDDYSPRALQKQMDIVQPIHLTNIIKGIGGVELARTERELLRRSRRDASFRIYPGSLG